MTKYTHVQLYLPNWEKSVLKQWRKVSNPSFYAYRKFQNKDLLGEKELIRAATLLAAFEEAEVKESYFSDVLEARLPQYAVEECRRCEKVIRQVAKDRAFRKVSAVFKKLCPVDSVVVLPEIPEMGEVLKQRVNLECMLLGLRGITLLAKAGSAWAEIPSVMVVAPPNTPRFSPSFSRKKYARYQHYHVRTYLWDPQNYEMIKAMGLAIGGRASPDLYVEEIDELAEFFRSINRDLLADGRAPLGFVGDLLYRMPHLFRRESLENTSLLPDSTTFWRAHVGLGRPIYESLREEILKTVLAVEGKGIMPWLRRQIY